MDNQRKFFVFFFLFFLNLTCLKTPTFHFNFCRTWSSYTEVQLVLEACVLDVNEPVHVPIRYRWAISVTGFKDWLSIFIFGESPFFLSLLSYKRL